MNRKTTLFLSMLFILLFILCLSSCEKNQVNTTELWKCATYLSDAELGQGEKTITVSVEAGEKIVTFTIHTDENTVGDALLTHNLIVGDAGAYGLYVNVVNGITADYTKDKSYWLFYIDGVYAMTAVDQTDIREGAAYQLVYTK